MPVPDKPGHWTFTPNAKLPSDQDLKKMVRGCLAVRAAGFTRLWLAQGPCWLQ